MRSRVADWAIRSVGNADELDRVFEASPSGCSRVTCSCMPRLKSSS